MGRYPVDVTTILVGCTCRLRDSGGAYRRRGLLGRLQLRVFDSAYVWHGGQVWRIATYAFVHTPSALLWFAIEMYMLFVFGREVERFIGQRAYIGLYLILLLAPTIVLTIWGLWQRSGLAGSPALHFGIFVAFVTIYPRVEMFLRIMAKWVVLVLAAVYTFQLLAIERLDRSRGGLDQHRRGLPFHRIARSRPGVGLVGQSESLRSSQAPFARCPQGYDHAARGRAGRCLQFDRSNPRKDFQIRDRQFNRQRTPAVGSGPEPVAQETGIIGFNRTGVRRPAECREIPSGWRRKAALAGPRHLSRDERAHPRKPDNHWPAAGAHRSGKSGAPARSLL